MIKNIVISIVLMVVGVLITKHPSGLLLAGIPYGWSALSRLSPDIFLWMPLIGWVIYFAIKLFISYLIGLFVLPVKMYRWISEMKEVKKLQQAVNTAN